MKEESEIFNTIISSWSDSENPLYDTYFVKEKKADAVKWEKGRVKSEE